DELLDIGKLRVKRWAGGIVDEDEELQSGMIALGWHPVQDLIALFPFIHHHILASEVWDFGTVMSLYSDDHVHWSSIRVRILLSANNATVQRCQCQTHEQAKSKSSCVHERLLRNSGPRVFLANSPSHSAYWIRCPEGQAR